MMVVGFLMAVYVIRRLSRDITPDPNMITNAALYSLMAGVTGARIFYVVHYWSNFSGEPFWKVFAIWQGGLELLGGVLLAIIVIVAYLRYHGLPVRKYLDVLAVGLMIALCFGRVGCFMRGCCFGKPSSSPIAVTFPYGSHAHLSQIYPDDKRQRTNAYIKLTDDFFNQIEIDGKYYVELKPYDELSDGQKQMVKDKKCGPLPVHPTQLYTALMAIAAGGLLWRFRKRGLIYQSLCSENDAAKCAKKYFTKPGTTFGLMFVIYGSARFALEFVRDDNPIEFTGLTVSQNMSVVLVIIGAGLMVLFEKMPQKYLGTQNGNI